MRTMSGGVCPHYDCSNRNSFGYCKTTICINGLYAAEWATSTSQNNEPVAYRYVTNADRCGAKMDGDANGMEV